MTNKVYEKQMEIHVGHKNGINKISLQLWNGSWKKAFTSVLVKIDDFIIFQLQREFER